MKQIILVFGLVLFLLALRSFAGEKTYTLQLIIPGDAKPFIDWKKEFQSLADVEKTLKNAVVTVEKNGGTERWELKKVTQ